MRKILCTVVLILGLIGSSHANATVVVDIGANVWQGLIYGVQTAWQAADAAWKKAKDAFDKAAWVQQAKDMVDSIQSVIDAKEKLTSEITGVTDSVLNLDDALADFIKSNPGSEIDYKYTPRVPAAYITGASCPTGNTCAPVGVGYTGVSSEVSSIELRNQLKVQQSLISTDIKRISNESAEKNAQDIAVIQAMATEAFTQAANRIDAIEKLKANLKPKSAGGTGPDGEANSLKFIADMQGRIQAEQALLINDQNKLAALAILQQSQRDAYEQRKKEIAAYVVHGDIDNHIVGRSLISAAQSAAYDQVAAAYR